MNEAGPKIERNACLEVRKRTKEMVEAGARMIAIVALEREDGSIELIYSFDRQPIRLPVPDPSGMEVDSVADIFTVL